MVRLFRGKIILSLILISILVGLLGLTACKPSEESQHATSYLLSNYDSQIGLIRDSRNDKPNVYWLYSDNYLVSRALKKSEPKIAKDITQAIATYEDIYQFPISAKWKVLSGEVVPEAVFAMNVKNIEVTNHGKEIRSEITDPDPATNMPDWQDYADLLLLASINACNRGDMATARDYFQKAKLKFDGIGFMDKGSTNDDYATYKLALFLIAAKKVGIDIPTKEIKNQILSLQEKDTTSNRYGGFYTDYDSNGKQTKDSDTNTETTSLVLLALN